ncbi:hypothetical protein [Gemella morbillorum]
MDNNKEKRNYTLSLKKDDSEELREFIKMQSNFSNTIRYLIYKEIDENGVNDISKKIYRFNRF